MSSSDKFPDWETLPLREQPFIVNLLSPAAEVAALMQNHEARCARIRQEMESLRLSGLQQIAQIAIFIFNLESALKSHEQKLACAELQDVHRHFRIIKDQMADAVKQTGLSIEAPLGAPLSSVADDVSVEGWRHHADFKEEVVAEILEPIIKYQGKLIHAGRVIMGAPPHE